jgi:hypothetical protein
LRFDPSFYPPLSRSGYCVRLQEDQSAAAAKLSPVLDPWQSGVITTKSDFFDSIGQSRRFCDVPVTSATFPTAAVKATAQHCASGQPRSYRTRARFADKVE